MEIKRILEDSSRYIMNTYERFPVVLRKGRGMNVWGSKFVQATITNNVINPDRGDAAHLTVELENRGSLTVMVFDMKSAKALSPFLTAKPHGWTRIDSSGIS